MPVDTAKTHRAIQAELRLLTTQGIVSEEQRRRIGERYPETPWNLSVLARWITLLGAVCAGAGLMVFVGRRMNHYLALEIVFGLSAGATVWLGRWLTARKKMEKTGAAVHLLSCFCLTGLTFTLGLHFSSGSGNWPALVGIDTLAFFLLAYLLQNRLVALYACINLFVWFGGQTGYVSGWGAYWLKMNYPLRFLLAGLLFCILGLGHAWSANRHLRRFAHFGRLYVHFGLVIANLSLWLFALFGYFGEEPHWSDNQGERLLFSFLWAACSAGSLILGIRTGNRAFRNHGLIFLLINLYTFYFQFVVVHSAVIWWLHLLLMGGSLVLLTIWLERLRSRRGSPS